jgi:hypothetical protein
MIPNNAFLIMFVIYPSMINMGHRITAGYAVTFLVFAGGITRLIAAACMPFMDFLSPTAYFLITVVLIIISSFAASLLTGIMGIASEYHTLYIGYMTAGQGIKMLNKRLGRCDFCQFSNYSSSNRI